MEDTRIGKKISAKHKEIPHKLTFRSFVQSLYLTFTFYSDNDLFSYASACTFGFLFSFIPVVMLILVVMVRFLHTTPEMLTTISNAIPIVGNIINVESFSKSIMEIRTITNFEIVIGIAIIWMARRFFSCVMSSFTRIFKKVIPQKPFLTQVLIFAGEAIIVIFVAVMTFAGITLRTIVKLPVLDVIAERYPVLAKVMTEKLVAQIPIVFIFFAVFICFKTFSRTKPSAFLCAVCSGCSTFLFWAFQKLMNLFINVNRYNMIYGVLSNTIVLLLEVYFFFMIFLFFAQYVFVAQFFDTLVLSELYLLPRYEDASIPSSIKRILFVHPDFESTEDNQAVITMKAGDFIYHKNDKSSDAYYLLSGSVKLVRTNNVSYINDGDFFGEESCLLNEVRSYDAICDSDVRLVCIKESTFREILARNPKVARKALSKISTYFAKFYGRTEEYTL